VCGSVLLIEDDGDLRDGLREWLALEGLVVACGSNGEDALRILGEGLRPSAILLDLQMPGMDGAEFRRRQLRDPGIAQIPVVAFTGDPMSASTMRALGVDTVLAKPIRPGKILDALERAQRHGSGGTMQ
jgi:CheY-like chemotaxis protein